MNKDHKIVAYIDLKTKDYQIKSHNNLFEYIGGLPLAYKILEDNLNFKPIIIANGPLSGKFPFASKTLCLYFDGKNILERYGGGKLHALMAFNGIDAICLLNTDESNTDIEIYFENNISTIKETSLNDNLNKTHNLFISSEKVVADKYFDFGIAENTLNIGLTIGLNFSNGETDEILNKYDYENLYYEILNQFKELTVNPSNNPSCFGCPMGCDKSKYGENAYNPSVLTRTLITCAYAEAVYKEIPTIFACLNTLGYKYSHEELQELPLLFGELKSRINTKIKNIQ